MTNVLNRWEVEGYDATGNLTGGHTESFVVCDAHAGERELEDGGDTSWVGPAKAGEVCCDCAH